MSEIDNGTVVSTVNVLDHGRDHHATMSLLSLLEQYLESIEVDTTFDRLRWIKRACEDHPELADDIRDGVLQIDALSLLAGGVSIPTPTIPGYQILRQLGQGGSGVVYEAIEEKLGRRVALKIFPSAFDLSTKSHARFMIEAQAAARLDNPHIVPIYAVGGDVALGATCFLSMKLIEGMSLDREIDGRPLARRMDTDPSACPANRRRSLRWMIDAAEAIADAHACGVIHRDIKPSNLMVDDNDHVWVTDFGLARVTSGDALSLTQTGDRVGTMAYMSPQQAAGEPLDARTDVYSLGLTFFELLTGRRAIVGETIGEVQSLRLQTESFHVRKLDPLIPRDLDTIVAKATAREVADRYQSANELANDLRRYISGEPILVTRPSLTTRGTKWLGRHRRTSFAIATSVVLGTALSWSVVASLAIANRRTHEALDRSQADLQRTEEILDRFGLLAVDQLRDVDGAESVRRELLKQTLSYYEDYANRIHGDSHFNQQSAITHFKAGQIIDEIGADADAIAAYETSARLFEETDMLSPLGQRTRALLWNNLAVLKAESGHIDEAVALYDRATQSLVSSDLARTYGNFAVAMIQVGNEAKAFSLIESGLRVLQDEESDSQTATIHAMLLSQLSFLLNDETASLETCSRTIVLLEQIRQSQDGLSRDETNRMLATAFANRGTISHDASDLRESLSLMESLRETLGHERLFLSDLASRRNDLGRLLLHQNEIHAAMEEFNTAETVLVQLCQRDQNADHYRASLAGVLHNLGRSHAIANDQRSAMTYFERSLELQRQLKRDSQRFPQSLQTTCQELLEQTLADVMRVNK